MNINTADAHSDEIQVTDYDTVDMTRAPLEVKLAALDVNLARQNDESDEMLHARALRVAASHRVQISALENECAPVVRLFGVTERGERHVLYMRDVWPYMYLYAAEEMSEEHLDAFNDFLCYALPDIRVRGIELVLDHFDLQHYSDRPQKVLRITLHKPQHVTKLRDFWFGHEQCAEPLVWCGMSFERRVFEANVVFNRRICVNKDIVPFSWVRVPCAALQRGGGTLLNECRHTLLQQQEVEALGCAGPRALICPLLRVASYDIECSGHNGEFPNAQRDPIISISVVLYEGVECAHVLDAVVFITESSESGVAALGRGVIAPTHNAQALDAERFRVVECPTERLMLIVWSEYLRRAAHANFLVGYNTDRFDTEYISTRAQLLSCWSDVGRLSSWDTGTMLQLRKSTQNTRAYGKSDDNNIRLPGVLNVDVFRIIKRETRLKDGTKPRSYKLGDISAEFLAQRDSRVVTKRDMPYTEIGPHWSGTPEQRWTLCDYNEWDSRLVGMLCAELCVLTNLISMARVTGVDVTELVCGGQQIKVYMQMLALARRLRFVIPTRWRKPLPRFNSQEEDAEVTGDDQPQQANTITVATNQNSDAAVVTVQRQSYLPFSSTSSSSAAAKNTQQKKAKDERQKAYDGAVVIEPVRGFYERPITTLDFSSLYPSIMRAHNLSHDTLVDSPVRCAHGHCMLESKEALQCCVHATPLGARFVNESVRRGLLPQMLTTLLSERGAAKRAMAAAKTCSEKAVYDGRQNALKISANSVYGFTGALLGMLPCIDVSAGVTAYGREMLMTIKELTERVFSLANGYHSDSKVVAGDTDSIMVNFNVQTVDEARQIGMKAATLINAFFDLRTMTDEQRMAVEAEQKVDLQRALECNAPVVAPLISAKHRGVITIVFEKVLQPFLLINKKRYVGGFWLNGDHMDHIHQSGIESVRRDNSRFTNELIRQTIRIIVEECNLQRAIKYARDRVLALARGRVPFDQLIVTKGYTKAMTDYVDGPQRNASAAAAGDKYKDAMRYTGAQPHLIVAQKRLDRHMQPYKMGERVPYVLVYKQGQDALRSVKGRSSLKNQAQRDIVEDPEYAQTLALMPNTEYYLKHQAEKPLMRIFDTALGEYATQRLILTADVVSVAIAPLRDDEPFFGAFKSAAAARAQTSVTDVGNESQDTETDSAAKRQRTDEVLEQSAVAEPIGAPACVSSSSSSSSSSPHNTLLFMDTAEKLEWWRKRAHQDTKIEQFFPVVKQAAAPKLPLPPAPKSAAGKKNGQRNGAVVRRSTWI
jgi:DNA polymerase elongation subunit (family B)